MKKKHLLLSLVFVAVLAMVGTLKVNSNQSFPLAGNCNDPSTGVSCAQSGCHPQPAQAASASTLTLKVDTSVSLTNILDGSFQYVPGKTYYIGFLVNSFTGVYGFQLTALDQNNNPAGTFTVSDATHTKIATSVATGSRQYMGHKNASSYKNWIFKWTAPNSGPVTFYYAYNTSDTASQSADLPGGTIYTGSLTIPGVTGINDISERLSDLNIFPNPVSHEFSLTFNMKKTEITSANIYSLDGKIAKELMNEKLVPGNFNRSFSIDELPSGIYLVKLNAGDASVTQKIIKE